MTSKAEWMANKHSEDIVYCFADGTTQVIRLVDYLRENPEYTAEDFRRIKEVSDGLHRAHYEADSKNGYYKADVDFDTIHIAAPEETEPLLTLLQRERRRLAVRAARTLLRHGRLSPAQKRRFIAYFLHGESVAEISRNENVKHQSISESIQRMSRMLCSSI
ncbi:MAG: hypothetical protein ACI3X2_11015 [Butyricicoccus porcorum]